MALSISETGLALIKKFEGCVLTAYQDSAGVWTIGYGHTSGVTSGQTITQAQADAYLKSDCSTAETAVNKYYSTYKWNQNQFDALVSFAFNIGNIIQLTANGTRTITEISNKITAYNKAGGKVLAGLVTRRAAEKELFDTAVTTTATPSTTVQFTGTVTATSLNVRTGAGTSYSKASFSPLAKGASVSVCDTATASDGSSWYYICYNGKYGYASAAYISKTTATTSTTTTTTTSVDDAKSYNKSYAGTYKTTARLNLRSGASTSKTILSTIAKGEKVTCYGYYTSSFLLVKYGNLTGFVSKDYLSKVS